MARSHARTPCEDALVLIQGILEEPGQGVDSLQRRVLALQCPLRRLKHVLIGNTNRKLELARAPDGVKWTVRALEACTGAIQGATGQEAEDAVDTACEALAVLASVCISQIDCLEALLLAHVQNVVLNIIEACSGPSTSRDGLLHVRLVAAATRVIKALYSTACEYVDPLGAESFRYDLIVGSARSKIKYNSAGATQATPEPKVNSASSSQREGGGRDRLASFSEQILTGQDSYLLTGALRSAAGIARQAAGLHDRPYIRDIIKYTCQTIAACARTTKQQASLLAIPTHAAVEDAEGWFRVDLTSLLFGLLGHSPHLPEESIMSALATLLRWQPGKNDRLISVWRPGDSGPWDNVVSRMIDKAAAVRLTSAECQVYLYKNMRHVADSWRNNMPTAPVLALLLDLLGSGDAVIRAKAAFVLAAYVRDDCALQETACNMNALERLHALLGRTAIPAKPYETEQMAACRAQQQEAALLAVSALCLDQEELRRRVLDIGLLPHIVEGLSSPQANVSCAAAQCTRSLSRSVNVLKTAFVDTNAAPALFRLLSEDRDGLTHLATTAVMTNVFVEFSPLKSILLSMDGLVERVVEMTKLNRASPTSVDARSDRAHEIRLLLRHHALTAIKNLTYWSPTALKVRTTTALTWEYIVALLRDPDVVVQTEMLNILRNIACNEAADIDLTIRGIGEARLFSIIEDALWKHDAAMLLHTLYLVSNIATGTDVHRAAIMNRHGIIRAIMTHLSNPSPEIRVAAVWAIVNLCHKPEGPSLPSAMTSPSYKRRSNDNANRLRTLGVESRLREMRDDPSVDVRERVREALETNFEPEIGSMPGGGMMMDF